MSRVRFSDASKSTILSQLITSGKIYVASDTHELYCDTLDGNRIKISDIEYLDTDSNREDLLAPLNKFYYVSDTNKLWYYNERWVQIGPGSQLIIKANGVQLGSYTGEEVVEVDITKETIGLGNVPNVATNDQTPTFSVAQTLATIISGEKFTVMLGKIAKAINDLISHINNKNNPHEVDLSDLGITSTANELNKLDGALVTVTEINYLEGATSNIQDQLNGKAPTDHGTHVSYGTSAPLAPGTANAGSANTVSRSDHRHPLQTTVSGNAGTATKLETARTINGVSFDGSKNITIGVDDGVIS